MYLRKSYLYNSIIKDVSYSLKQILDETLGSLYLNDNSNIKNEFNIELTNELINFYIPNKDVLKTCVLYNYNIDESILNNIYNKIKMYNLNNG